MKINDVNKVSAKANSPQSSLSHVCSSRDASTAWVQAMLGTAALRGPGVSAVVLMADSK